MKVLIIDDAEIARDILKRCVNKAGHEVIGEACDGEEGIIKFKELKPDLIILDISMPKMDGIECLRKIKELDTNNTKVVMCSMLSQSAVMMTAFGLGATDYITKPFKEDTLILRFQKLQNQEIVTTNL